jgi:hypothetical protein
VSDGVLLERRLSRPTAPPILNLSDGQGKFRPRVRPRVSGPAHVPGAVGLTRLLGIMSSGAPVRALRHWMFHMRRILLSIAIAVGILLLPLAYLSVFPSASCLEGGWCEPTSVERGAGWIFLPGLLLVLPFEFFGSPGSLETPIVVTANTAVCATVVWLLLRRRARRLEGSHQPMLPL